MAAVTVTALVSGGKDSVYSAYLADSQGLHVDELLTLRPSDPDSFLFHTPNLHLVALQAEAWGKKHRSLAVPEAGEEAEGRALEEALSGSNGWVVAGAIASAYQWSRLHRVCFRLGRPLFTPLWGKEPGRVVREEISAGLDIRLVHLAAEPLTPDLLGRRLDLPLLEEIERRAREQRPVHVAGEGGEYESLVVDAPFFRARLEPAGEETFRSGGAYGLRIRDARLAPKPRSPTRGNAHTPPAG
ncbi:MAG TPA: diphthine--ammonia ligase [Thermoplasmata archaeon]